VFTLTGPHFINGEDRRRPEGTLNEGNGDESGKEGRKEERGDERNACLYIGIV
jgi:hypothetical protein